ncbi:U32 family peptidase [Methanohalophilus sp. RSK]|uniref:peptidase U32 family protein n=1 Tax=Methanohalophilus sp. RSK TaxID=2485783 RepID=UPI000F4398BF|nr:peptidase U32 family protein [Methanohalophilus sp. RSK]RNI12850.1 U32 family peptidase [Methanohalophilus sp. RSK]
MKCRTTINIPELAMGVKNRAALVACKDNADAVYFSLDRFSLRARARAISLEEFDDFVAFIHSYDIKAYLTLNSVIYPNDLDELDRIMDHVTSSDVDAVIAWDPSVIMRASDAGLNVHISTQANVSNQESVEFYKRLGASRVVLARELNLEQIKSIRKSTSMELEVFIHGAMCQAISGRCYLSAYLLGKSGNCGECSQPCRWDWSLVGEDGSTVDIEGHYLLSARDLCMIEHIPELVEAGIDSFKVEGRLRDTRYTSVVSSCYRRALDEYRNNKFDSRHVNIWMKQLSSVYNRGFSTGFYFGIPSREGFIVEKDMNASQTLKELVGEVVNYYKNQSAAYVKLTDSGLNVGDTILIEGENTHLEQHVSSIQVTGSNIKSAAKGMDLGLAVDGRVRPNDKVFRIADSDKCGSE